MKSLRARCTVAIAIYTLLANSVQVAAQTQRFTVVHNFTGGQGGEHPYAGLAMDPVGNLYGTTNGGGSGFGAVFKLSHTQSGWVMTQLRNFQGGSDGAFPLAGVTFGPDGGLYGTTNSGGSFNGGTIFGSGSVCENPGCVLYRFKRFTGSGDGAGPNYGDVAFDHAGSIYGVTILGGFKGQGSVYELTPSRGGWKERVLYAFSGSTDGAQPFAGLIFDDTGNLYGTAQIGGSHGFGTVYQLTPSGSGWAEKTLYAFQGSSDGAAPVSSLLFDQSGNLFGSTCAGGAGNGGAVFELAPSNGNWTFSTIQSFTGSDCPWGSLTMDAAGNLYGTTVNGGNKQGVCYSEGCGTVYKLTLSGGSWTYTDIHDFTGPDGQNPYGRLILDASSNLYGTTANGGTGGTCGSGCGVVFKLKR